MRCEQCCGTCRYHAPFEQDRFMCTNLLSQEYMNETDYQYNCDDWEEK